MPKPSSRTSSTRCVFTLAARRVICVCSGEYFIALSSKIISKRDKAISSPCIIRLSWISCFNCSFFSAAKSDICAATFLHSAVISTCAVYTGRKSSSLRASVIRFSVRRLSLSDSLCSIATDSLAKSLSLLSSSSCSPCTASFITASGVRISCEASAVNCCCLAYILLSGRILRPASQ